MKLASPVTVQAPGSSKTLTLNDLSVTLLDNATQRSVRAKIHPFPRSLTLWSGEAYDAAGDYTQAQAEARILELLGPNIKAGLEALFVPPATPVRN